MPPCACHCAVCRAAGHGNTCVLLRMLFDSKADVVDLVLRHYHGGASGWDTERSDVYRETPLLRWSTVLLKLNLNRRDSGRDSS